MGVGTASLPRDRVDGLDELRTHLEETGVRKADDVGLADAGLEHLEDALIDAVNHRTGLGEQD